MGDNEIAGHAHVSPTLPSSSIAEDEKVASDVWSDPLPAYERHLQDVTAAVHHATQQRNEVRQWLQAPADDDTALEAHIASFFAASGSQDYFASRVRQIENASKRQQHLLQERKNRKRERMHGVSKRDKQDPASKGAPMKQKKTK
jgi:hypothetical protein